MFDFVFIIPWRAVTKAFYIWYMKEYFSMAEHHEDSLQEKLKKYLSQSLLKKIHEATRCHAPGEFDDYGSNQLNIMNIILLKPKMAMLIG
ncbi:hypothetical protein FE394_02865 [Xenorhabdus sp. Reich]|uniref:Uncharacterized protein n=1 Tax=Xenorhabdus littoralis TaxID=2582835 RepID=A0ABU4SHV6_9GAMM|nr:hypothetical protein [Xenorhabdus sp. Reich]MDX7998164.1 hypothetical protein [Xenorhabdus sp. Reich]